MCVASDHLKKVKFMAAWLEGDAQNCANLAIENLSK